jgi:hypothetical protein
MENKKNRGIQKFNAFPDQFPHEIHAKYSGFLFLRHFQHRRFPDAGRAGQDRMLAFPDFGYQVSNQVLPLHQPNNLIPIYFFHRKVLPLKYYFFTCLILCA